MDRGASSTRRAARRVRHAVGSRLPDRLRHALWERLVPRLGLGAALGHRLPGEIDAGRAAEIDSWPIEDLTDAGALAERLAGLGINDELAGVLPAWLRAHAGTGLRASQYPNQFAPYLALLATLGIRSYIEIGVDHGGTFLATTRYLNRFHPLERAVAVDRFPVPALRDPRIVPARRVEVLRADSGSRRFARFLAREAPFDLALIDADHSERRCRADFRLLAPHARVIALHDIAGANTPGVRAVWREIRETRADAYTFHEFVDQYGEIERATGERYMGLGVAIRR